MTEREIDRCVPPPEELDIPTPVFQQTIQAVRTLLVNGLPAKTVAACVRLRAFERYGGGLKSPLVGGLSIHLGLTLKLGDRELDDMMPLFEAANDAGLATKGLRQQVFPACHIVLPLESDAERRLAVMDHLRSYASLFDVVAKRAADLEALSRAVHRATRLLDVVHELPKSLVGQRTSAPGDLYFARLRTKLEDLSRYSWVARARTAGINLTPLGEGSPTDTVQLPGLDGLLDDLEAHLPPGPDGAAVVLHGDPHLANIMLRKNGSGFSVRLIDPNPAWGVGDYLYDVGKAFHFAGEVGMVREDPSRAEVVVDESGVIPALRVPMVLPGIPEAVRERQTVVRVSLEAWRNRRAVKLGEKPDGPRFHLAVATATLATASMLKDDRAVAYTVHRALWHLVQASRRLDIRLPSSPKT